MSVNYVYWEGRPVAPSGVQNMTLEVVASSAPNNLARDEVYLCFLIPALTMASLEAWKKISSLRS